MSYAKTAYNTLFPLFTTACLVGTDFLLRLRIKDSEGDILALKERIDRQQQRIDGLALEQERHRIDAMQQRISSLR